MIFDLTVPSALMQALGPDLLLMAGAMLLLLWAAWRPESAAHQRAVGQASLVLTLATLAAVTYYAVRDVSASPGVIAVDNFRWTADAIILIATFCTIALSIDYNEREEILPAESHVMVLFATSGMMLLAAARDLMIVFLGIELMSVAVYVLAGLNRRSARAAEGALKYFLLGAFSTGFLLYGIALVYGATASTDFTTIGIRVAQYRLLGSPMLMVGIALLLVGFAFKVAAVPFHMWAPDVYEGAPTPITAYMAAAVKAAAFAAFLRIFLEAFPDVFVRWHAPVWWLAVATMVAGNVIALAQRNIKRLLAYSSIAHAGYVLVALATGTPAGSSAFLFYLFAYTLATMGAFAVVVALGNAGEPNLSLADFGGLWRTRPWLAVAMSIFMLALLGFPVFGGIGFFAKWYVLQAALRMAAPQTRLAVVLVLTSVISAGYYLYVVMVMFMRPRPEGAVAPRPLGGLTGLIIGATAVLILAFGLYPNPIVRITAASEPRAPGLTTAPPPLRAARVR